MKLQRRLHAYFCDSFALPLPAQHSFPMEKYVQLRALVEAESAALGIKLVLPERVTELDLLRVHCPNYIERVMCGTLSLAEQRKIGFPWSIEMAERSRRVSGASKAALADALSGDGVAVNLAGGTHHAFYDSGGGYCVFNDAVIAARAAQAAGLAKQVLIVDLDVHQGNGTAAICANDTHITTFSMHGARNYPAIKQCSDLDVTLASGMGDQEYLGCLSENLPRAFDLAEHDAVIYLAGADPFELDRLGLLKLSKSGLLERDRLVFDACLARRVPISVAMAGGYAPKISDIVEIHMNTVRVAANFAQQWQKKTSVSNTFANALST